jgi:AraC family transcriptional regulator
MNEQKGGFQKIHPTPTIIREEIAMEKIKIVKIPACKVISSGRFAIGDEVCNKFSESILKKQSDLFPHDFMWFDSKAGKMVWYYVLLNKNISINGFEIIDFEGGLYASAVAKDGDDADGKLVYNTIKEWIDQSDCFELDEREEHQTMFNMPLPCTKEIMGYAQIEIYVPMKISRCRDTK